MKRIKIVPYNTTLHITDNFEEWNKKYTSLTGIVYEGEPAGLTYDHFDGNLYVGVFSGGLKTLAHELGHVCLHVSDRVQLGDIVQEQEAFCYMLGHLTAESIRVLPQIKDQ